MSEFDYSAEKHAVIDTEVRDAIVEEFHQFTVLTRDIGEESYKRSFRMPAPEENGNNLVLSVTESILPNSTLFTYELFEGVALDGEESAVEDIIPGRPLMVAKTPEKGSDGFTTVSYFEKEPREVLRMLKASVASSKKLSDGA